MDMVKSACLKVCRVHGNYSIDEQMITFTVLCSLFQHVRFKLRPGGFKDLVLVTAKASFLILNIYIALGIKDSSNSA
jgi:hypothetical protein